MDATGGSLTSGTSGDQINRNFRVGQGEGAVLLEYRDVYAGGRLVGSGSTDVITIVNPATEEVAGAVPSMVERDV